MAALAQVSQGDVMDWIISIVLGYVPTWAWVVVGGVALGVAWRWFGWQGVVGGLAAVLTLGAYRQGWRDRDKRDADVIGKTNAAGDRVIGRVNEPPPPKKRRTVMDILNGR